jgi:predicted nucleotidyltransferase
MRLNNQPVVFFKQSILGKVPEFNIYLFGSRTSDEAAGGDIDILIISKNPVNRAIIRSIRIEFYKRLGWQKLDLVNFTENDQSVFKQIIQSNAIEL